MNRKPGPKPSGKPRRVTRTVSVSPETAEALDTLPGKLHGGIILDMARESGLIAQLKNNAEN